MIISYQVIEHVASVKHYLENIKRLLKPDGLFIITTPCRTYRLAPHQKPWNRFHLREYDLRSLKEDMERVFPNTCYYSSISENEEVLTIEKERCRPARSDYDKKEFHFVFKRANYVNYYSTKDFFLDQQNIDYGLDLIVSNKKLN